MTNTPPPAAPEPTPPAYSPAPGANAAPAPVAKYNTLAIVGFILAFFVAIAGLIVSIIARGQIKRTGEQGGGLALAGIIISVVVMVFWILWIVLVVVAAIIGASNPGYSS